jgi:NTP pyrophosphatase (non-canonical NTP hydrolase)
MSVDLKHSFVTCFNVVAEQHHEIMVSKKFWETPLTPLEAFMLMVSELGEAGEAFRHGNPPDDKIPEFSGVEAELADVILRIMDYAEGHGLRVAEALVAKLEYNKSRPEKHGKAC